MPAIATALRPGQRVVLDHGSLPQAIRASMALPGLFSPTDVDGRTLIDGGITSNLPIETVREMGADIVIAVDIGSHLGPFRAPCLYYSYLTLPRSSLLYFSGSL